jgi:hypothetical protein
MCGPDAMTLTRIAERVRVFLQGEWPGWHIARGRQMPVPMSRSTCQTSSLFLQQVLQTQGIPARVVQGNDPTRPEGIFFQGQWHGHAWVQVGDLILDITGDQFDLPPVYVTQTSAARFRAGADTATDAAKRARHALVNQSLSTWKKDL